MRLGLVFAIACACGAPPVAPKPPAVMPSASPPAAPSSSPMIASQSSPRAVLEAPPAGPLDLVAVTPDGSAAITADQGGGIRLWPALDGTREPRVVTLGTPIELALARAGSGFIVASIDEGHDLTLTLLDADGRTLAHRGLGGDPAVVGVAAIEGGLLAWSSDQKITLFGTDGATRGTLGTRPGERLFAIAVGGTHVVAEVQVMHDGTPHGRVRALAIDPALAWGDFVDADHEPMGPIALSPSGKRLAMTEGDKLVIVDVGHAAQSVPLQVPATSLAFVDEAHVAATSGLVQWFEETGLVPAFAATAGQSTFGATMIANAAGRVVAVADGELALATSHKVEYLGYRIETPSIIEPGGSGSLMVVAGSDATLLDSQLRSHGTIDLEGVTASSAAWLGGDDWFSVGGQLRVVSSHGSARLAVDTRPSTELLAHYEPSTQLATTSLGDSPTVYRWDAKQDTMTAVAMSQRTTPYETIQLVPTAPAQANGVKLVRITVRDHATVEWFSDDHLKTRTAISEVAAVLATDHVGRVYAWTREKPHVAILANGAEVGRLPLSKAGAAFPDATGDRIAVVRVNTVELYAGGKSAWSQDVPTVWSAAWLSDGALAVVTAAGIERLDPATGEVAARRCGWGFGLSPNPLPATPQIEPVCAR